MHDRLQTSSDDQWDLIHEANPPLQPLRPPTLTAPQSPSLSSLNHNASPMPSPLPRSTSPYSTHSTTPLTNQKSGHNHKERDQQLLRKKPPSTPNSYVAVGILNSLNPTHLEPVNSREQSDDGFTDSSHREEKEKKEKRPFWDRSGNKDKDKDKEREREKEREKERVRDRERDKERDKESHRDKERRDEAPPAELTRLLGACHNPVSSADDLDEGHIKGYLFATASEDWSLVLEVCDRVSQSEENAKEAAKALRREFKCVQHHAERISTDNSDTGVGNHPHSSPRQGYGPLCSAIAPLHS